MTRHIIIRGPKADQGEYFAYWWWQNLSDDDQGNPTGPGWRQGRATLRVGHLVYGAEWKIPTHFLHFAVGAARWDDDLQVSVATKLFALWLSVEGLPHYRWLQEGRRIDLSIHDGSFWWELWACEDENDGWRKGNFDPARFLFGKEHYSKRQLRTEQAEIPMPEASYPATLRWFESTWKRPRWPWARRRVFVELTPETPIPIPGKGENSWDIGDDASMSMTCTARNGAEAVGTYVGSVLERRERHGGKHWRPAVAR